MDRVNGFHLCFWCIMFFLFSSFSARIAYRVIPSVTLGGKTKGRIDAKIFSNYSELNINGGRGDNCHLVVYTLYHISLKKEMEEFKGNECHLPQSIIKAIRAAKSGDKYVFFNIKVQCDGDKTPIKVNSLNFNIK